MQVRGDYHHLGAFVAGVAGLSRIVTLHDFTLKPAEAARGTDILQLSVQAKTYRYAEPPARQADAKGAS
ncbi:type 4a pilus biogenesis protein PilO [Kushneria phosphatilytica]|uniref:type 4a pilus biogenesis protein PilO n=1 Tax=Kushneria phosphatilytica TaxID=657387 RepID=UPI0023E3EC83|nr:type 4a pilus biogenesis protein PilO [Kushneria phosphatilytica]